MSSGFQLWTRLATFCSAWPADPKSPMTAKRAVAGAKRRSSGSTSGLARAAGFGVLVGRCLDLVGTELPPATPLIIGAADGPLANLGVGATPAGVAAVSLGTSGALRTVVGRPTADESGRLFCYALTEDRWVIGGAVNKTVLATAILMVTASYTWNLGPADPRVATLTMIHREELTAPAAEAARG